MVLLLALLLFASLLEVQCIVKDKAFDRWVLLTEPEEVLDELGIEDLAGKRHNALMTGVGSDPVADELGPAVFVTALVNNGRLVAPKARYQIEQVYEGLLLLFALQGDESDLTRLLVVQLNHQVEWAVLARQKFEVRWLLALIEVVSRTLRHEIYHVESLEGRREVVDGLLSWIRNLCKDVKSTVGEDNVPCLPRLLLLYSLKHADRCIQQNVLTYKHT